MKQEPEGTLIYVQGMLRSFMVDLLMIKNCSFWDAKRRKRKLRELAKSIGALIDKIDWNHPKLNDNIQGYKFFEFENNAEKLMED